MIYKSEITGKEYRTEKECIDDEVAFVTSQKLKESDTESCTDEKQEAREKITAQNKVVEECVIEYERICREQNEIVDRAKEAARKAKDEAHKKAIEETNRLGTMLYEYQKKYSEYALYENGKFVYRGIPKSNTLADLFSSFFDIR